VTVIDVALLIVKQGADGHVFRSSPPKNTSVAVVNPVPVSPTLLPPAVVPVGGATVVSVGGVTYVYGWGLDVPPGFSTVTSTWPAAWAGTPLTVIDVLLLIVKQGADGHVLKSALPKNTSVAVLKLVPVRVTLFPPAVDPAEGATVVNDGGVP
jgi:hypothetical protein